MTAVRQTYMLDTTVFNAVLDGKASIGPFIGRRVLVTDIQANELRATSKAERREALLAVYEEIGPTSLPAASFAFDIEGAGFDQAYWNDGSGKFKKMLTRLRELDLKNKSAPNQLRDILIAETAIKNGATLLSGDSNLRKVVAEFGGDAIDPDEHFPNA